MASSTLREIASLQEEFRSSDLDQNGALDYWRKDIAELCRYYETHLAYAQAEDRPVTARSSREQPFLVRAMRFQDEKEPDPRRFAACCFPARYGPGIRSHYIISHERVVYKKDLGHGNGIEVYPADPVKEGWEKLD